MADDVIQELERKQSAAREIRRRHEGQWFVNLAYYLGYQWVEFDGNRLWEPPLAPWQIKLVDNRIQPAVRVNVARKTKTRPQFVGVPTNSEDDAIAAARLTERVLDAKWDEMKLSRVLRAALTWVDVGSVGYVKTCWDKTKGRKVRVLTSPDGQVLRDANRAPMTPARVQEIPEELRGQLGDKTIPLGDISCEVRPPLTMYIDPISGEEGMSTSEWVIEEVVVSLSYAQERFNYDGEADATVGFGSMESMLPAGIGQKGAAQYRGVRIREYWHLPCSEYPNGAHVVWAGTKQLEAEDNPYPWLPYTEFRGIHVPGRYYPDAIVTQLISPQTELNKRKAQLAENAARIGNPPLARPEGSSYEFSGLPGGELVYVDTGSPNARPDFMQVPEMPSYIREDIGRIEAAIQEITGQHDVSHGVVPAGVTAASAINLLQEADDTRLGPEIQDMELAIADWGEKMVWLVRHYYNDERMIRMAGEDGAWDILSFRGKQLEGVAGVEVQAGSMMPRSKAAKQAAFQDVLNLMLQYSQQPMNPRDLRKVFQEYEVGGLERFFADLGEDERQIARENQRMANGEQIQINSYDNDAAHIDGHEQFQKSATYDHFEDDIKANFEEHVQAHRMRQSPPPPEQGPDVSPLGAPAPPGAGPPAPMAGPPTNGNGPAGGVPFIQS